MIEFNGSEPQIKHITSDGTVVSDWAFSWKKLYPNGECISHAIRIDQNDIDKAFEVWQEWHDSSDLIKKMDTKYGQ